MSENSIPSPTVRNLDLSRYNDTDQDISAEITVQSRGNLIDNPRECSVSITRFRCPLTTIPIHRITTANDPNYAIEIRANLDLGTKQEFSGVSYMDVEGVHPLYSPSDFTEQINRTIARAWYNLIDDNLELASFKEVVTNTSTFSTSSSTSLTMPVTLAATNCYGVKLDLSAITPSSINDTPMINIDLVNPTGLSCRVASGVQVSNGDSYSFHTGGQRDQGAVDLTLDANYSYQPIDSFLKFSQAQTNGNWIIVISQCGSTSMNVDVTCTLSVYKAPQASDTARYDLPYLLPNLSLDSSSYTNWSISEKFIKANMKLYVGNHLKSFLSISKRADSNYIRFPISSLSAGLDQIVVFVSDSNNIFSINQISKLLIFCDLPVQKDLYAGDSPSFALTSFVIPGNLIEQATEVSYSTDAGTIPWRRYQLMSDKEVDSLNISARVQYNNGEIKVVELSPGQTFQAMLSIFKN